MREIQASEAKTHFSQLLDEVERGQALLITRHGRAVAQLTPATESRRSGAASALARIRARRKHAPSITVEELLALRDEGRKR